MTAGANSSLVQCKIGGRVLPVRRSPSCRTCRSEVRRDVEIALAEGRPYVEIVASFPESGLTARHLSEHFRRGHLPLDSPQVRKVVAERAAENTEVIKVGTDVGVEALTFARLVLSKAAVRLANGDIEPSFKDAIAAARVLADYDAIVIERDDLQAEVIRTHSGMTALLRLVQGLVTDEEWAKLSRAVDSDPELRVFSPPPGSHRVTPRTW